MTLGNKLPRKEDLLRGQEQPKKETTPVGENSDVKSAKDAADVAKLNYLKIEQEINTKLLQEGYKSFEDAKADVKKKQQEMDRLLIAAQNETESIAKERGELEIEKQKVINAFKKVKDTEELVKVELEEAKRLEQDRKDTQNNHNSFIKDLRGLVEYHELNIRPVRKTLLKISYLIYEWADSLQNAKVDFESLYNQIGTAMRIVDRYIEKENKAIPKDVLDIKELDIIGKQKSG